MSQRQMLAADRDRILALPHSLRRVDASAYLVREGDRPDLCAVIASGIAVREKSTGDGARQILGLLIPGDAVDFQHLCLAWADHSVRTIIPTEAAFIPRSAVQKLARDNPAINAAILTNILIEAASFREWLLNVGQRRSHTRLAHFLCEFAVRINGIGYAGEVFEMPLKQELIGEMLGLTAIHVNRLFRSLDEDGLIIRDKRRICFPHWPRMIDVADFDTRYLHLKEQQRGAALVLGEV